MSALEIHVRVAEEAKPEFAARCAAAVQRVTGFDLDTLRQPSRRAHVVAARRALIWLLFEVAQLSYSAIGRLLHQDHTSVRHSHLAAKKGPAKALIVAALDDFRPTQETSADPAVARLEGLAARLAVSMSVE